MDMTSMSGPTWLADFFAAVMLSVAFYSAGRLRRRGHGPDPPTSTWTWHTR